MYSVKTRNWNGNRFVEMALNVVAKITGVDYWPAIDHDTKYYKETSSACRAWLAWGLFMALRPLSGGWTYIVRPGADVDMEYKAIY